MSKLFELNQLDKLAKALDKRSKESLQIEKERAEAIETNLQTNVNSIQNEITGIKSDMLTVDAVSLNGYSIWVGTTAELNAIEERDPNTIYFEIGEETSDQIVQNDPANGYLTLTKDKYQKTTISSDTQIVFPAVENFTEIHLFLNLSDSINFVFSDKTITFGSNAIINMTFPNCKWRMEPNIEAGTPYEIIATYNSMIWMIDIVVYS